MIIASNGDRVVAASVAPMPDQRERARRHARRAAELMQGHAKQRARARAQKHRGREHAADRARADGR